MHDDTAQRHDGPRRRQSDDRHGARLSTRRKLSRVLTLVESVTISPKRVLPPPRTILPPVAARISALRHPIPRPLMRIDPPLHCRARLLDHRNESCSRRRSDNPRALCRRSAQITRRATRARCQSPRADLLRPNNRPVQFSGLFRSTLFKPDVWLHAGFNLGYNRLGQVLRARIVRREHHDIAQPRRDLAHQWPLAAVAIAAATENGDQPAFESTAAPHRGLFPTHPANGHSRLKWQYRDCWPPFPTAPARDCSCSMPSAMVLASQPKSQTDADRAQDVLQIGRADQRRAKFDRFALSLESTLCSPPTSFLYGAGACPSDPFTIAPSLQAGGAATASKLTAHEDRQRKSPRPYSAFAACFEIISKEPALGLKNSHPCRGDNQDGREIDW